MRFLGLIICAALAVACAARVPDAMLGPNGRPAYSVECLGKEQNCYPLAKKHCPKGYTVTDSKYRAVMNWQGFEVENTLKYTLVIECQD